jgi:hypothetical protein
MVKERKIDEHPNCGSSCCDDVGLVSHIKKPNKILTPYTSSLINKINPDFMQNYEVDAYLDGKTEYNQSRIKSGIGNTFLSKFEGALFQNFSITKRGNSMDEYDWDKTLTKLLIRDIMIYGMACYVYDFETNGIKLVKPYLIVDDSISFKIYKYDGSYEHRENTTKGVRISNYDKDDELIRRYYVGFDDVGVSTLGVYVFHYRKALFLQIRDTMLMYDDFYTELDREAHKASTKILINQDVDSVNSDTYMSLSSDNELSPNDKQNIIMPIANGYNSTPYTNVIDRLYKDMVQVLNVSSEIDAYATATAVLDRDTQFEGIINDINNSCYEQISRFLQDYFRFKFKLLVDVYNKPYEKNNIIIKSQQVAALGDTLDVESQLRTLYPNLSEDQLLIKIAKRKYEQKIPLFINEEEVLIKYGFIREDSRENQTTEESPMSSMREG